MIKMFDLQQFLFGACLFITSFAITFKQNTSKKTILSDSIIGNHISNNQSVSSLNENNPNNTKDNLHMNNDISLIDFMLPYMEDEIITNLINDELISTVVVGGTCKKFYICIHADKAYNCPETTILNYISILYSKIWNEAIIKNVFDLECSIICDDLNTLITREEVLGLSDVTCLYTLLSDQQILPRKHLGLNDLLVINIYNNKEIKQLINDYRSQPSIIVLDSHYEEQNNTYPIYAKLSLGGTFDHMHYGHRKLLTLASICCNEELIIGITSASMLSKKSYLSIVNTYNERKNYVQTFMNSIKPKLNLNIVELFDPFGPTINDPDIEAIIVSSETIKGAFKINQIRKDNNMKLLDILITYRTDPYILSSSFIREKSMNIHKN